MSDAPHVSSDALTSKPLALRVMPMPADLNPAGDVFGGWIMAMVDVAGAMPAIRRAGSRVVTVAVNSFVFKQPVGVGDIVSFHAEVAAVGKSSVTVDVEVFAERNPKAPEVVKVTEARLTYVAVGDDGSKRTIPAEAPAEHAAVACQLPADKEVVLQVMPMPAALNPSGDVFGGWIMSMVDVAAAVPAMRHAKSKVATVSVDSFVFKQPVSVGDLVSFHAAIVEVGHTCVTVDVEVFAQRNPAHPEVVKVTEARLRFVALDEFHARQHHHLG